MSDSSDSKDRDSSFAAYGRNYINALYSSRRPSWEPQRNGARNRPTPSNPGDPVPPLPCRTLQLNADENSPGPVTSVRSLNLSARPSTSPNLRARVSATREVVYPVLPPSPVGSTSGRDQSSRRVSEPNGGQKRVRARRRQCPCWLFTTLWILQSAVVVAIYLWGLRDTTQQDITVMVDAWRSPHWEPVRRHLDLVQRSMEKDCVSNHTAELAELSAIAVAVAGLDRLDHSLSLYLGKDILAMLMRERTFGNHRDLSKLFHAVSVVDSEARRAQDAIEGAKFVLDQLCRDFWRLRETTAFDIREATSTARDRVFGFWRVTRAEKQQAGEIYDILKCKNVVWSEALSNCSQAQSGLWQEFKRRRAIGPRIPRLLALMCYHNSGLECPVAPPISVKDVSLSLGTGLRRLYLEIYETAAVDDQSLQILRKLLPIIPVRL